MTSAFSIRARLILLVVSAAAPLLVLLALDAVGARRTALDGAEQGVRVLANLANERRQDVFGEAKMMLSMLRDAPGVTAAGGPACSAAMVKAAARYASFMTIGVARADGMTACDSKPRESTVFSDTDIVDAAAFSDPDDLLVGRMIIDRITNKPTLFTALPLRTAGGAPDGLVFASIDLSILSSVPDEWRGPEMAVLVVEASDGRVAAATGDDADLIGKVVADQPLVAALRSAPEGGVVTARGFDGRSFVFGFAPLAASNLSQLMTVVSVPREEALTQANEAALRRFLVALAVAASVIGAAWMIGSWALARPISLLTETAERIGCGDLSARTAIEPWQAVELRSLGTAINDMAGRLDEAATALRGLAHEDALTGLANRRKFDAALKSECARAQRDGEPLSLLLIDVDLFKPFNDRYGHLAGDVCLKRLARCVGAAAARAGDLAARYGGEEFALILPRTDENGARVVAEGLRAAVQALRSRHEGSPRGIVTVSIGGDTTRPSRFEPMTPEGAIERADKALYAAKAAGRDAYRGKAPAAAPALAKAG